MKANPIRSLSGRLFPYLVLFAGLIVTGLMTYVTTRTEAAKSRLQFESAVDKTTFHIESCIRHQLTLLRAGSVFFSANHLADTCAHLKAYGEQVELSDPAAGIQAFGLSIRLSPDEKKLLEKNPAVSKVWPNYPRLEYHTVLWVDPLTASNQLALGYDMSTDTVLRQAMQQACDSGRPAASARILVGDNPQDKRTGFMLIQPLYRAGKAPATLPQRRQDLCGHLYCTVRTSDFIGSILEKKSVLPLGLEMYDAEGLFYSSGLQPKKDAPPSRFQSVRTVTAGERSWRLVFTSLPQFESTSMRAVIFLIPILGFFLSSLLFIYLRAQETARSLAESQSAELRNSESLLRESMRRFETLVNTVPVGIWETGLDQQCIFVNQTGLQFTGRPPQELKGYRWRKDVHPEDLRPLLKLAGESYKEQREFKIKCRLRRFDGQFRWFWINAVPLRGEGERFLGYIGTCFDMSEQETAQEALRASEELYRMVAETAADVVLTLDEKAVIRSTNEMVKPGFDYAPAEVVGQSLELLVPELLKNTEVAGFLEKQEPSAVCKDIQIAGKHRDGSELELELSLGFATKNGVPFLIGTLRDISQRKKILQAVFHVQKMQAIGSLASGIAHDFNNVFTAILSHLDLALCSEKEQANEHLNYVKTSAGRGAELVKRLLTFSRQSVPQTSQFSPSDVVKDTVGLLQRSVTRRIEITAPCAPGIWTVKGDESQIKQVLINLCLNARDAMPEGGSMVIELANATFPPTSQQPPKRAGDFVKITVRDTGSGMSKQVLDRLFEPYFTTKDFGKGAGLGLSIAHHIVTEHGGWIEVDSAVGQGSRFHIFLPRSLCPPDPQSLEMASSPKPKASLEGTETILVADDDYMVRNLMRAVLAYRGYKIIEATDGAEAIEKCLNGPDAIELVLLDLEMPKLDGWQALEQIHKAKPLLPVVLCSGSGVTDEFEAQAMAAGACRILSKPFTNPELLRLVRETLNLTKG